MADALERFRRAKEALHYARSDAKLIGDPYSGGGGGVGRVVEATGKVTIYHQRYDGATNYHRDNEHLNGAFSRAIAEVAPDLIKRAIELLEADVEATKAAAAEAYRAEFGEVLAIKEEAA